MKRRPGNEKFQVQVSPSSLTVLQLWKLGVLSRHSARNPVNWNNFKPPCPFLTVALGSNWITYFSSSNLNIAVEMKVSKRLI